jgi:hypothetical protein
MVANSTFDKGLQGFVLTKASGNVTTSVTNPASGEFTYLSGNIFSALMNAQATNYWDQGISWRFPAQQAARYKVNFNYRVTDTTPINTEVQEASKDNTAIYRQSSQYSGSGTTSLITNDVSLTDPFYTLNIQYGKAPIGTQLLLDNITLEDITGQWDGNYLVNGDFECQLDSWVNSILMKSYITGLITDTSTIAGNYSFQFTNTYTGTVNRINNRLYWKAYLPGGWKYRLDFMVQGSGFVDATFRSASATSSTPDIAGIYQVEANSQIKKAGFDIPVLEKDGEYIIAFTPQGAGNIILDNIRLYMPDDTTSLIRPVLLKKAADLPFFPNPARDFLYIASCYNGSNLSITDLYGHRMEEKIIEKGMIDISTLKPGMYLIHFSYNNKSYPVIKL